MLVLRQNKCWVNKKKNNWKDYIAIFQEPVLEKSYGRNWKDKQIIDKYPNKQHH